MDNKKNTTSKKAATPKKVAASASSEAPVETVKVEKKKRLSLADVQLNDLVEVRSCFYGGLTYISSKTGYRVQWGEYGAVQYLTVEELLAMRNSQPAFFINNWVAICGDNADDVIDFLQIKKYYKDFPSYEDLDNIFSYTPERIREEVDKLPDALKENIARRAYALIQSGELDSIKVISALEEVCGFELRSDE